MFSRETTSLSVSLNSFLITGASYLQPAGSSLCQCPAPETERMNTCPSELRCVKAERRMEKVAAWRSWCDLMSQTSVGSWSQEEERGAQGAAQAEWFVGSASPWRPCQRTWRTQVSQCWNETYATKKLQTLQENCWLDLILMIIFSLFCELGIFEFCSHRVSGFEEWTKTGDKLRLRKRFSLWPFKSLVHRNIDQT